ncbi:S-phase kinase-associated protein, putative [Pediculus humanus corporis]|uniref:S-phase kinase-associated protein, putative n=1 Tax=Pediculus humanus subsp. corporis TaxID=121224 RepID=E0VAK6_PEDHC|nr:S-phase kinase-associated protein, putative [Pediculus humanus corporis]EEB10412.1 S-phase kinase-associated protein, putative [Pediculus humanus corporis]
MERFDKCRISTRAIGRNGCWYAARCICREKPLIECINNNSQSNKGVFTNNSSIPLTTVGKGMINEKQEVNDDAEKSKFSIQKEESDDGCILDSCEDSSTKENSKSLKWEKLKPINCKIRNSKIIYQNEITVDNNSKSDAVDITNNSNNKDKFEHFKNHKEEKIKKFVDDSDFFLSRRPKIENSGVEDEVILSIFYWLPKKSLVTCALVCKRFLTLAYDEVLWTKMDLGGRNLPSKSVGYIVSRGFRILRLAQSALPDPVFCPLTTNLPSNFICKLQYLDLSMASISPFGLATFLNFCKFLKKLSLENCHLNNNCCSAIAENVDLEVLNLTMCIGLTTSGIDSIFTNCRRLQALNISWTGLSVPSLNLIACKVPSKLERLNISGNVIEIFHRCENLIELDVSDSIELTDQVINFIVKYVKRIEYLSFSRCYSINTTSFLLLKDVRSLMFLDVFGLMSEEELNDLKNGMPDVAVNQFPFSSVARPTVGLRRTSIWGLKVRD